MAMDDTLFADLRTRMEWEGSRDGAPDGFPKLPDIPIGRYTDPRLYELEKQVVFKRSWLYACHESEVGAPGRYKVLDLPIAPVVLARGRDGVLRAFLNACRHRGAPVVRGTTGSAKYLTCQYHAWSYDLTGKLVNVTDQRDFVGLDPGERGLVEVRCEQWGGFVFINLDPEARPLLQDIASLDRRFAGLLTAELRPVATRSWAIKANWKVLVEAFLEGYHLKFVHRNSAGPATDCDRLVNILHEHGHSSMFTPFSQDFIANGGDALMEMFFPTDVPAVPDPQGMYREANPSFLIFPNLVTPTDVTGFFLLLYWPLAIDRSRLDMLWFGVPWGDGDRPPGWDVKLGVWDMLMAEDVENLEPIQRSLEAAAHAGVPLSYQERRLWQFHADIDKLIGPDRVPEELRIPDLLADYIEA